MIDLQAWLGKVREVTQSIHIINPFLSGNGGSERRSIELHRLLSRHADVRLWASNRPDPELARLHSITTMTGSHYPRQGTFIFMGAYQTIRAWYFMAKPRRVILIYNMDRYRALRGMRWVLPVLGTRARSMLH